MESYIGRLLDNRYEILEVIGTGGMAVVYKALDHRLNRLVAMKILKDDLSMNQESRRRFHAESQAVAMLSHPNIVSVFDVSHSGDGDYIVMELIEGISLKQYLEKKINLNWRETLHFSMQIAKALEHAHGRGIVHRDIKPHNILILKDGSIKVADFGIARVGATQNTLAKEALGSVHYISPEQAKGSRVDNRSDLYSLGVVMYEMLTGRTPYDGETPVAVALQHVNGGARRPSELVDGIPPGLEQIALHAMTVDADERYMNASDMLRDMEIFRKNPSVTFNFSALEKTAVMRTPTPLVEPIPVIEEKEPPKSVVQHTGMTRTDAERYAAARNGRVPEQARTQERRAELARKEQLAAEEKKKKRLTIAIIVASAILLLLVVLVVVLIAGRSEAGVPNLVGMVLADINPNDYDDYTVDVVNYSEDYSDTYPEGIVMRQYLEGNTIKLVVSKGPELKIPDYKKMKGSDLQRKLLHMNLNLDISIVDESSTDVEEGYVIRTEPPMGTELKENDTVIIYVSLGENKVPDLTNDTETKARSRLNALELELDIEFKTETEEEYIKGVGKDRVTRTDPPAGSLLNKGSHIVVFLSPGATEEMPNLKGKTKDEADKILKEIRKKLDNNLKITYKEEESDEFETDKVTRTDPAAGSQLSEGDEIIVYISIGKTVTMPELYRDTKTNAESRLNALKLDLKITFVDEQSNDVEAGRVIRTEPAAGTVLHNGDTVKVVISSGSGKVTLEDFYLWSEGEAYNWLTSQGLNCVSVPTYDSTVEPGYVVGQSEYSQVDVGTTITIYVSIGPESTETP